MSQRGSNRGFTLVEALVATALFAAVLVGLAQLLATATTQSLRARQSLLTLTLAQSKLEYLRSLDWRFDAAGARVSSHELAVTPADAHAQHSPPFQETLDRHGRVMPPNSAGTFIRRWSIISDGADADTLVVRVCVFVPPARSSADADACVWGMRTRRP
jgi:prepilin-type N-terminal cleavage/methylation domain-containing protein